MKNYFTKAIVAAGVVASVVALNSFAVFAAVTCADTSTLSGTQMPTIGEGNICTVSKDGDNIKYVYDFANIGDGEIKAYGLTIVSGQANNDMFKFSSTGTSIMFKTDKTFDLAIDPGKKKCTNVTINKGSVSNQAANNLSNGQANTQSAGTYYLSRSGGDAFIKTLTITVHDKDTVVTPTSIKISASGNKTSIRGTKTLQLSTTMAPEGATGTVNWSSDNESVATVDENGLVTAKNVTASSSVGITATIEGTQISDTYSLTVDPKTDSTATKYQVWDLTNGLVDDDNGNGLYALDVMPYNGTYVVGSTNGVYAEGKAPTGAALKLVSDTTGVWNVTLQTGTNKTIYAVEESGENYTLISSAAGNDTPEIWNINVEKGKSYYILASGSKAYFYSVSLTKNAAGMLPGASNGKCAIAKENGKYYGVALISADKAEANKSFKIGDSEIDEVYESVTLPNNDDVVYTPVVLGGAASDLVYGFELNITGATTTPTLAELQGKAKVSGFTKVDAE